MNIRVGTDLVKISRIRELSEEAKSKIFHSEEKGSIEHMAGVFALKECCKKIFGPEMDWKSMQVKKLKTGQPQLVLSSEYENKIESISVSVSHEGDYALAFVVAVIKTSKHH